MHRCRASKMKKKKKKKTNVLVFSGLTLNKTISIYDIVKHHQKNDRNIRRNSIVTSMNLEIILCFGKKKTNVSYVTIFRLYDGYNIFAYECHMCKRSAARSLIPIAFVRWLRHVRNDAKRKKKQKQNIYIYIHIHECRNTFVRSFISSYRSFIRSTSYIITQSKDFIQRLVSSLRHVCCVWMCVNVSLCLWYICDLYPYTFTYIAYFYIYIYIWCVHASLYRFFYAHP